MSGIFLSYRRDDASGWAGRLYEHLVREWGPDQVFMDIDAIAPGEDFRQAITRTIDAADVVMVVIGPNWLDARDEAGNRRLDNESDTHRAEVAAALAARVRVVPVLVGGAAMPNVPDLPEPLKDLAYRNAARIEDRRFTSDVDTLQHALKRQLAGDRASQRSADEAVPASGIGDRHRLDKPYHSDNGSDRDGHVSGAATSTARALNSATVPTMLAVSGMLLTLVWGVLVPRPWHNELWGLRVGAGGLLVVLAAASLWSRRWKGVLMAGISGLVGLAIWMLSLVGTHVPDEVPEIFSPGQDGTWNGVTFAGALLVVAAGLTGMRAHANRP